MTETKVKDQDKNTKKGVDNLGKLLYITNQNKSKKGKTMCERPELTQAKKQLHFNKLQEIRLLLGERRNEVRRLVIESQDIIEKYKVFFTVQEFKTLSECYNKIASAYKEISPTVTAARDRTGGRLDEVHK